MLRPKFPHIPREISASLLWAGLTLLFLFNVYAKINMAPSYEGELVSVLTAPFSPAARDALARRLWEEGVVLGIATDYALAEQMKARARYEYWRSVVAAKPDYRDAYVSLAAAAYQLGYFNEAKTAAQAVLTLDPSFPLPKELRPAPR